MEEAVTQFWVNQTYGNNAVHCTLNDVNGLFRHYESYEYWEPLTLNQTIQHPIVSCLRNILKGYNNIKRIQ